MKSLGKLLQNIPFYPLLLGIYPVLFLWEANYFQVNASAVLRSLLISVVITVIVCLACLAIVRQLDKGALLAGLFLVLFFTYGHIHSLINKLEISGFPIGRHRYQSILWGILFLAGAYWILHARSKLHNLNWTINLVASFLVILASAQLGFQTAEDLQYGARNAINVPTPQAFASVQTSDGRLPDIYYFILDGYSRQDFMKTDVHLDNGEFIAQLEQLGFVVPNCTQSNYNTTTLAMDSTLNMEYIEELGFSYPTIAKSDKNSYLMLVKSQILQNQVMKQFKEMGYQIITLKNDFPFIDFPKSDVVYNVKTPLGILERAEALKFQNLFMQTTLTRMITEESESSPKQFRKLPALVLQVINPDLIQNKAGYISQLYQQQKYQLDQLETVAQIPGKKFLYAHIMVTHPPYLFTRNGDLRADTRDKGQAYADQVIYANKRMLKMIKKILSLSKTPPVIILQGDHAKGWEGAGIDGFKILNAYYLPGAGKERLYATITPVNSFRLVLSEYFGKDYPLLPDQSIEFDSKAENGFQVIPESCVKKDER